MAQLRILLISISNVTVRPSSAYLNRPISQQKASPLTDIEWQDLRKR